MKLQDALGYFAGKRMKQIPPSEGYLSVVLDAARRVANLDEMVERAMRKAEQMGWPDQMDVEEVEQSVRGLIIAALGIIPEDTE